MDLAMAPPLKRRKIFDIWRARPSSDEEPVTPAESSASFSHDVETLSYTTSDFHKSAPQRVDEVHMHMHVQQRAPAADADDIRALQPRQGTGSSTTSSTTSSTIAAETTSDGTSTATSDGGTATSSTSSSPSASPTSSESSSVSASPTSSESSSASSESTASSTQTSLTTSTNTSSVGSITSTSTESSTASSTPTSTLTSTNASSSSSASQTSSQTSSQPILTGVSSSSTNSTTSTFTSEGSSTATFTTTFAGNLSTTSTSHATTSTNTALLFFATLENGTVETFTRFEDEYTTTVEDGEVFTIPAISATTTDTTTTTSQTSSSIEQTPTEAVTSIAYITTLVEQSGSFVPTTITSMKTVDPQGAAGIAPTSTSSPASASTGLASSGSNDNDNTPPAGTIAGGVVGGAAGLAVVLLIAMLFVRWYRRRSQMGHQALPPNSFMSPDPSNSAISSSEPGMAERAGLRPLAAAVPGLFRHQDRSITDSEPSERGFTKVSGRKLPSQFSPGMSSSSGGPPPEMPLTQERNVSTSSFYQDRDSRGYYNNDGESPPHDYPPNRASEMMTVSQGPQRRPTIHHPGGPWTPGSSTGYSSPPGTAATFGDSLASLDPSRNSRFNEEL